MAEAQEWEVKVREGKGKVGRRRGFENVGMGGGRRGVKSGEGRGQRKE